MPSRVHNTTAKPVGTKAILQYGKKARRGAYYAREDGAWRFTNKAPKHLRGKKAARRDPVQDRRRKAKTKRGPQYGHKGDPKKRRKKKKGK
jgi:hypothetical protein